MVRRSSLACAAMPLIMPMLTWAQSRVDANHKFCWSEHAGWMNWHDAGNAQEGVHVNETYLSGNIWAEDVGWIQVGNVPSDGVNYTNMGAASFGVNVDIDGNLVGYAWAENAGWINFDTSVVSPDQARLDSVEARFRGYAWSEHLGWINLDDSIHFVGITNGQPIPTTSQWGLACLVLLMATSGSLVYRHRGLGELAR